MTVRLDGGHLLQGATGSVRVEVTAPVNITAFVARQKVTRYVITEISTQLLGEVPDLMVGDRLCWAVPVVLTLPGRGIVAKVGEIAVDASTGELLVGPDTTQRMADDAHRLAESSQL